jgi:tRNA(Ile)-lysidine synthase
MATAPLTQRDFSERLDRLGPFETAPHVAVAVSGGADSMALLLLAAAWAADRSGRVTALTVDHGLRAEAAAEAAEVARRCRARGIACETMRWDGDKPATGIQEAARSARYDLMTGWCRDRAVAHLLVAHHAGDQAETFLYRMGRGSGADGLAGMPAAVVRAGVRLLRPLLDVAPERLRAVLDAEGETWLDDPSNRDGRFARVAVRRRIEALGDRGFGLAVFGEATAALGAARAGRDRARARLAAGAVALYPEGYAEIALDALCRADADSARDLLAVVLHTIGGAHYAPRRARLGRLADDVLTGDFRRARTLGGCAIVPDGGGSLRIWREPRAATETVALTGGPEIRWDGRFALSVSATAGRRQGMRIARLGETGWQSIAKGTNPGISRLIPGPVRFALPALWDGNEIAEVPHLGYRSPRTGAPVLESAVFRPNSVLATVPFRVV